MRELRIGEDFAGYRVERELGRGGVGAVYAVRHLVLDRPAALKVILPSAAVAPDVRERFVHESRVVAALDHPSIVPIYDAGELEGVPYITMRYVAGGDLDELIRRQRRLEVEEALRILEQVASALDAAHDLEIVHRDVKPGNVLIEEGSGRLYLTDFGIAASRASAGLTQVGLFVGTSDYASPEQIQGQPVDGRADVYALACVAFECLTGARPYVRPDPVAVLHAHLLDAPPSTSQAVPGLPQAVDQVLAAGLAKSRDDRYPTCRELVADLRAAASAGRLRARAAGSAHVSVPPLAPPPLPSYPGVFVGREHELDEIVRLLSGREARLVTLVGAGGIGKTRLAVEAAVRAHDSQFVFRAYANLADATGDAEIAQAFGLEQTGDGVGAALQRALDGRRALLLCDAAGGLDEPRRLLGDLLAAVPELTVLATSYAPIDAAGECVVILRPLALPAAADEADSSPAVKLFLDRARAAFPDLATDEEAKSLVVDICRRLDGVPLALELAANRLKMLTPRELLARLERPLDLLGGGAVETAGGASRRTLRETLDLTYSLVPEDEQALLARLAVFRGGCSLEAAEAVAGEGGAGFGDVLDRLASLVDKGLVARGEGSDGESRFVVVGTIRDYALEQLEHAGGAGDVRRRHARFFLELAERAEPELTGPSQQLWSELLDDERGNLDAALEWATAGDAETGLRLGAALVRYWSTRGAMTGGLARLEQLLESDAEMPAAVRARALFAAGYACIGLGEFGRARDYFEESLTAARSGGETQEEVRAFGQLAWLSLAAGDIRAAEQEAETVLEHTRDTRHAVVRSGALAVLGSAAEAHGNLERATELHREALALRRRAGDARLVAHSLLELGRITHVRGAEDAEAHFEESLATARSVGDTWLMAAALTELARLRLLAGATDASATAARDAIELVRRRNDRRAAVECVQLAAALLAQLGERERAAALAGAADSAREALAVRPTTQEKEIDTRFLVALRDSSAGSYSRGVGVSVESALEDARAALRTTAA